MLFNRVVKEFLLESQIRNLTPKTIKGYRNTLEFFCHYLQTYHQISDLEDISVPIIKHFILWEDKNGKRPSYINGQIKVLRAFFKYCRQEEYDHVDMRKIPWKKKKKV